MPDRAEYQPLAQDVDDNNSEGDVAEVLPSPVTASRRGLRRGHRPGNIDLGKLDHAFKRYVQERAVMLLSHTCPSKVDRVHCAESQAEEEGGGQLAEGDLA